MTSRYLVTTAAAALALSVWATGANAAAKWDGGDDLPTSPLECGMGAPPAPAPMKYDGGQPTNPPDKAGKEITVVDVPKLIGIGYFNATSKGIQDAAKELGNVKAKTDGPDRGQDRRADQVHRQLHHQRRGRHSVRRQRSRRHRAGAEESARRRASTSSATTPTRRPTRANGSSTRPSSTASPRR